MSKRIVFLASGGGGNMKFIHQYYQSQKNAEVVGVIADRNCGATEYAAQHGVINNVFSFNRSDKDDTSVFNAINELKPDYIVTNIHKILSGKLVQEFSGSLLNLHYSYLPAFSGLIGMDPVNQAIEKNNSFIGTTCHWVNEEVDAGNTISQGIFSRYDTDNLYQSVFECGALTLLNSIELLISAEPKNSVRMFGTFSVSPAMDSVDYDLARFIFKKLKS
jgi:phosphoribosylglycinamide formyltransferase-1